MTQAQPALEHTPPIDGRRRRTLDSRARIIAAMLDLTQAGHISVSAELVAERAKVGLRTVFRHFKDMDSLYREMSLAIEARLREEISIKSATTAWPDRLSELIGRRVAVFERITPFKRAEAAHRHRSKVLEQDIKRLNLALREILAGVLPPSLARDPILFEAFDMILSFETWDRLRREQGLGAGQARAVLEAAASRLIAGAET